jgi:hypothetical protein
MSLIKELRELGRLDGTVDWYSNKRLPDALEDLEEEGKVIKSEFEDYGRWSNYVTKVYKIEEDGEVAYFEFGMEKPATESQDGMELSYHFLEVKPVEKVIIEYVAK